MTQQNTPDPETMSEEEILAALTVDPGKRESRKNLPRQPSVAFVAPPSDSPKPKLPGTRVEVRYNETDQTDAEPVNTKIVHSNQIARTIKLYYTEDEIGPKLYDAIQVWFSIGNLTIRQIVSRANEQRRQENKPDLDFCDVYSLLYRVVHSQNGGRLALSERPRVAQEMLLKEFALFFKAWKAGGNKSHCISAAKPADGGKVSQRFIDTIYGSLMRRWRQSREATDDTAKASRNQVFYDLFSYAKIMQIEGKDYIVIDPAEVPINFLEDATRIPITASLIKRVLTEVKAVQKNPTVEPPTGGTNGEDDF